LAYGPTITAQTFCCLEQITVTAIVLQEENQPNIKLQDEDAPIEQSLKG